MGKISVMLACPAAFDSLITCARERVVSILTDLLHFQIVFLSIHSV